MLAPPMMKHSSEASLLPTSSFLAASASSREVYTSHPVICSLVFEITILRRLGSVRQRLKCLPAHDDHMSGCEHTKSGHVRWDGVEQPVLVPDSSMHFGYTGDDAKHKL